MPCLGRQDAQHVRPYPSHGETREPVGVARIRELDLGRTPLASPRAEHLPHRLEHLERLPRVRVVQKQHSWPLSAALDLRRFGHCRTSLAETSPLAVIDVRARAGPNA